MEKTTLMHAMYEMVDLGVYKCDNGFKASYLNHLEEMLKKSCPTSGIKAKPHIESKVNVLKKQWSVVNNMILGIKHGSCGFGFDSNTYMVTAPPDAWDEYLKSFSDAKNGLKYAVAQEDALEEVEKIDSSSESHSEVECTTAMPTTAEDMEITSTTSRSTPLHHGNGNPSKKKKKVSNDTYLADQMVVARR
ncbi:hypothetical protein Syun_021517 [Stephania yunnanensis]|uniref:Myb/SANT-like domain-containing protein n=1 Tax=Stephania yunnanensis TaxID=152371 RepID=A0AAP0IGJ0_9MAGN